MVPSLLAQTEVVFRDAHNSILLLLTNFNKPEPSGAGQFFKQAEVMYLTDSERDSVAPSLPGAFLGRLMHIGVSSTHHST